LCSASTLRVKRDVSIGDIMVREYQGKHYVHVAKQANFAEAENWCKRLGMELATINNSAENKFITTLANDNKPTTGHTWPWIGLHKERGQRWRNLTLGRYTNWQPGWPDEDDCVYLAVGYNLDRYNGKWYDTPCSKDLPFVCSK